jgi:hypothetical protein
MRPISTRVHGIVDYATGALLLVSPYLFGFSGDRTATTIALIFGLGAVAYSVLTDYELGVIRLLPMVVHVGLDALAGGILALLPIVVSMDGRAAWIFGLVGLFSLAMGFLTRTERDSVLRTGSAVRS